jgi:hypothetical protein
MTPEERADLVWGEYHGEHARFVRPMAIAIAEQIHAAIAEEREACAQIALATNDCCECGNDGCHVGSLCPTAAAIRARQ